MNGKESDSEMSLMDRGSDLMGGLIPGDDFADFGRRYGGGWTPFVLYGMEGRSSPPDNLFIFSGTEGGRQDRQDHPRGDLRERLERRGSPLHRRHSQSRDGKGGRPGTLSDRWFSPRDRVRSLSRSPARRRGSRSYTTPPRSPSHKRRESKKLRMEAPDAPHLSDVSGDHYGEDNGAKHAEDDKVKSTAVTPSPSPRDTLQEQLRQVQLDNDALVDEKENLENALGKKVEEASVLTAQNAELETKLSNSQDDSKRYGSKMKKLIKVYLRCTRAQEEVKKTQAKLQKMAEEFPFEEKYTRPNTHADDSDFYNLSEGEAERPTNGIIAAQGLSALNVPPAATKVMDVEESLAIAKRKRLHAVREKTRASIQNMQQNGGSLRDESLAEDQNLSGHLQNSRSTVTAGSEMPGTVDMFLSIDVGSSKEVRPGSDRSPSLINSPTDKVRGRDLRLNLSATGHAAHGRDFKHGAAAGLVEEKRANGIVDRERVTLNLNMPPRKSYQNDGDFFGIGVVPLPYRSKYKGDDDEVVDVDSLDIDMDEYVGVDPHEDGDKAITIGNYVDICETLSQ